jgi:DNA-binding PadR family transcriptional regulator
MSAPHALLGLLEAGPSHGYDLKRSYDRLFGESRPLPFGQLYNTLARLERDGRIAMAGSTPGSGPERKLYVITDDGVAELSGWLSSAEPVRPQLQAVMFVKVVLALLSGRAADAYLDAQRSAHLAEMRTLADARRAGGLPETLLADYGLFHLEADLRWIDVAAARLDALRTEVHR